MATEFPRVRGIPSCVNLSTYVQGMSDYELLCEVIQVVNKLSEVASLSVITYADPLQWNITTQYSANTVVIDQETGVAYLSKQPVPAGVQIFDTDYWTKIANFDGIYNQLISAITNTVYAKFGMPAREAIKTDSLVWIDNVLYKCVTPVSARQNILSTSFIQTNLDTEFEHLVEQYKQIVENTTSDLNRRLSSIIADGTQTEGNTELIDIRTGADGKVYRTAGDAVRGQIDELNGDLSKAEENTIYSKNIVTMNRVNMDADTSTVLGYLDLSGSVVSNQAFRTSDFKECLENTEVTYRLYAIDNISSAICFYGADKNLLDKVYHIGTSGSLHLCEGTVITPKGTKYLKYCYNLNYTDQRIEYIESYNFVKEQVAKNTAEIENLITNNVWNDKKWVCFGTSITDTNNHSDPNGDPTGKYVPYLLDMSGLSLVANRGIAGACMTGHILYYINYYTSDQANSDLVTIEGSVNDWQSNIPLGEVGDVVPYQKSGDLEVGGSADGTFAGACYKAFTNAQMNAPNAKVVYLTDNTGYADTINSCARDLKNKLGFTQLNYIDTAIKVAEYVGIPVIDCGRKSQINNEHREYLVDRIHHTQLGGKQYARTIWAELKNMYPLELLD